MTFLEIIVVAQLLRQQGTGELIPRPSAVPNRPQYQHPGGPVGKARPSLSWSDLYRQCVSPECRLFCKPENEMRPDWCAYYTPPKNGYLNWKPTDASN